MSKLSRRHLISGLKIRRQISERNTYLGILYFINVFVCVYNVNDVNKRAHIKKMKSEA